MRSRSDVIIWLLVLLLCLGAWGCSHALGPNLDVVTDVVPLDRESAEKHHRRGVRLAKVGKLDAAEHAFQNALIADETFGPAHNNLGLVYFEKGDLYSAAWSFQRAMEFMPEHAAAINNLGMVLEAAGRLEEAIGLYQSARSIESDNPQYLGNLLRARRRRGDKDDSLRLDLQELIFLDPRPEWVDWAQEQLALYVRPPADVAEEVEPADDPIRVEPLPAPLPEPDFGADSPSLNDADGWNAVSERISDDTDTEADREFALPPPAEIHSISPN